MASKKAKEEAATAEVLHVVKRPNESDARAMARTVMRPTVNNAATIRRIAERDYGEVSMRGLVEELAGQCAAVSRGDMERPEALLTAQAHTLDSLFNQLTRLAYHNWGNFNATERLLRLAFKAQSQSRATVEALGNLRNPPMVIARQANIAHGHQQVNNGDPTRTRETQTEQSKLLEQTHGERMDTGAAGQASGADSHLETVGAFHRPNDGSG